MLERVGITSQMRFMSAKYNWFWICTVVTQSTHAFPFQFKWRVAESTQQYVSQNKLSINCCSHVWLTDWLAVCTLSCVRVRVWESRRSIWIGSERHKCLYLCLENKNMYNLWRPKTTQAHHMFRFTNIDVRTCRGHCVRLFVFCAYDTRRR